MSGEQVERIWKVIDAVPTGKVVSYGQVAELAGIPRGARQTARALRLASREMRLPWFRVVTASGKLAFKPDDRLFAIQVGKLQEEDVVVLNGRVNMKRFRWQPDLDELLWAPWAG